MLEPSRSLEEKSAMAHFGAGVVAEVCGALIWTPMDVIKQRQQTHTRSTTTAYATVPAAMRTIFREHGFRGFFTGIGAALATYAPFVGIYFVLYEQWKRTSSRLMDRTDAQLPFAVHLTGGAVAGGVSAYVTTPLDVVKTRFQVECLFCYLRTRQETHPGVRLLRFADKCRFRWSKCAQIDHWYCSDNLPHRGTAVVHERRGGASSVDRTGHGDYDCSV